MRRTALIILAVAGGFVALVLIAVAIAVAAVDVNTFVAPVAARVKSATGRDLTVLGHAQLSLSLEPKLIVDDVAFSNAPWAHDPAMLTAKRLEAQVALLPLLKRRFEVVRLTLVDPVIALETDVNGRGNWQFGPVNAAPASASTPAAAAVASAFGVGELEIRDGTLTYRDALSTAVKTVRIEMLTLHARNGSVPIDAAFRGTINGVPLSVHAQLGPLDDLIARRFPYPVTIKGDIAGRNATLSTKLTQADAATHLDDLVLTFGATSLSGQVVTDRRDGHAHHTIRLTASSLAWADLPIPATMPSSVGATAASAKAATGAFVIPNDPLPLSALRGTDADGKVHADSVTLRDGQKLANVDLSFTLRDGVLDATLNAANVLGGTLQGHVTLTEQADGASRLKLVADGRGFDLAAVLAAAGTSREVHGGKTRMTVDVTATGRSMHEWAGSMSGQALLVVTDARLGKPPRTPDSPLAELAAAANPFHGLDSYTELQCAVIRLPLRNGVANVNRTIAVETSKLAATASGTLDFGKETLDLSVRPQIRQGVPIEIPQIADLVRVRGSFRRPQITVDAIRSAATVARIGAAIGTGGWSMLAEGLLVRGAESAPCSVALGGKSAAPADAGKSPAAALPADVGRALGRLLGR